MSNFITRIDDPEGAYYVLTKNGYFLIALVIVIAIIATAVFLAVKKQKTGEITTKQLVVSGISLALAFITSYIKFEMPMGGSVTLFSMFFICFIGYLYGVKIGMITAFAYSLLQFLQSGGSYFLSPFQICCDYFFAFTALGLTGLWYRKQNKLVVAYAVACITRGIFHTIGGYIYWMDYMPAWFPASLSGIYSIVYNYSYILAEMLVTILILQIPVVRTTIQKIVQENAGENIAPQKEKVAVKS